MTLLRRLQWAAFSAALALLPVIALAQSTPAYQSGPMSQAGNLAKMLRNGEYGDAAGQGVLGDLGGNGVNPFGVQDNGAAGVCSNSANSGGQYNAICIGHDTSGNGLITLDSYGGLANKALNVRLNGATYAWAPGIGGNVVGPGTTAVSEFALWNNISGTLLANAANNPIVHTNTFPGVANGVIDDLMNIAVGGAYPSASELAGVHGFTATMLVPSNAPQTPHPNSAISAWIQSASTVSTNTSSVLAGGSFSTGEGTNPYGSVLTVCNCAGFGAASNTGHDFKFAVGQEVDMESLTRSGGVAGTGQQWGFLAVSYSDILPAGGAIAYAVQNQGTAGGFHYGFYVNDNSAVTAALHVGQATTGNSNSQTIEFKSTLSSTVSIGTLQYQEGSNFVFAPQSAMGVLTTTGHYGTSAGAVAISACGTSPSGNSISNDSSGEVLIGGGTVTACTVTFATAYASTPKCAFQNSAAIATGWNAKDVNHFIMTFASDAHGTTTDYWCAQ